MPMQSHEMIDEFLRRNRRRLNHFYRNDHTLMHVDHLEEISLYQRSDFVSLRKHLRVTFLYHLVYIYRHDELLVEAASLPK